MQTSAKHATQLLHRRSLKRNVQTTFQFDLLHKCLLFLFIVCFVLFEVPRSRDPVTKGCDQGLFQSPLQKRAQRYKKNLTCANLFCFLRAFPRFFYRYAYFFVWKPNSPRANRIMVTIPLLYLIEQMTGFSSSRHRKSPENDLRRQ